ncbi:CGNR zinc finger domain-containing protein [Taklimakanibacter lacteus]|uniref:CGNR zinc finger domain-containing protein n=1 Tax=Taklimakanibacter lacteus TaxID=2268456 RepID=UPI000E65F145
MKSEITFQHPARLRPERLPADFALAFVNTYDPVRAVTDLLANPEHCRVFLSEWCELDWDLDWGKIARRLQLFRDDLRTHLIRFITAEVPLADFTRYLDHKLEHWPWIARPVAEEKSVRMIFVPSPQLKPVQHVEAVVTRGIADLIAELGPERLHQCQSQPCEEIFADHSKSGRQRFCGKRCATRFNVAMFRKRKTS